MANHASARKAERQSVRRRDRNRGNRARVRTQIKKLRQALDAGDAEAATGLLSATVSEIDVAAKKGALHDNAAARHKSRLTRHVRALAASKA